MIIPALDLMDGGVVRLHQGDFAQRTDYAPHPLAQAQAYAEAGAPLLHIVDLDGARDPARRQLGLLRELAGLGVPLQVGGGIREERDAEELLALGVARVVVGSLAAREPARVAGWLRDYGAERVVAALDLAPQPGGGWRPMTHGWERSGPHGLDELLHTLGAAGLKHVLCTDISRDGTLGGANAGLYRELAAAWPGVGFQASGGVAQLSELPALRAAGAAGVILGKSLLAGRFTAQQALAAWEAA